MNIQMQQRICSSLRRQLALATTTLLAQSLYAQPDEFVEPNTGPDRDSDFDVSYLSYAEEHDGIQVDKVITNYSTKFDENDRFKFDLVYDTMSGATPSGALPVIIPGNTGGGSTTPQVVTFTTASGRTATTTVGGGGASMADQVIISTADFQDKRTGLNAEWQHDFGRRFRMFYGASISDENDYRSSGLSVKAELDSEQKLTTFTAGVAAAADDITRVDGGVPVPLSNTVDRQFAGDETRDTVDVIFGVTRVLTQRSLAQFNVSFSRSDGYHNDPYKIISVADAMGNAIGQLFEGRPDSRQRDVLYAQYVYQTRSGDNPRVSYRYYDDDWGVQADTLEVSYRFNFLNGGYLEPQFRQYEQNSADFYYRSLPEAQAVPEYASADHRLADMSSKSIALKLGFPWGRKGTFRVRVEQYDQSFDNAVIASNKALIFQLSYKKGF